jgi:hypothetical protein
MVFLQSLKNVRYCLVDVNELQVLHVKIMSTRIGASFDDGSAPFPIRSDSGDQDLCFFCESTELVTLLFHYLNGYPPLV